MILWLALLVLLAVTLAVLLRPLLARPASVVGGDDREVFAAQLDELEADRKRGLIGETEAEAARAEIARRLLRAKGPREASASPRRRRYAMALVLTLFVSAFSLGAYMTLGTPQYADQPLAARMQPISDDELVKLVAEAEAELAKDPEDGRGWIALAPVYQRLQRFADAANAYAKANELLGENADWLSLQGENLAYAGSGAVSEEARALFERALVLDPNAVRPAIFLAIAARQAGDFEEAGERWRALLERSKGDEPWLAVAQAELSRMGLEPPATATASADGTAPQSPGGAAGSPPPMVEAMVKGLAERLQKQGGSVEEWVRLVRSYTVLGRMDDARAAVDEGLAALEGADREAFAAAPEVASVTGAAAPPAEVASAEGTTTRSTPDAAGMASAIEGMVQGLSQRLRSQGGSVDEWVLLVRSYTALGRMDDARATVESGLAALKGADREAFAAAPEVAGLTGTPTQDPSAPSPQGAAPATDATAPPPMVEAMVQRLAARLDSEGGSVDEWVRLVRSYTVLGRLDDARAAIEQGLAALQGAEREAFAAAPEVARLQQ